MAANWISSRRTASCRYLTTVLLILVLGLSLTSFYMSHPSRSHSGSHLPLGFDVEVDLHMGQIVPGGPVELDLKLNPIPNIKSEAGSKTGHIAPLDRPLGMHTFTPDGLLVVNPEGPHPIFQLIRDAEVAWEEKLAQASKTLEEAVAEYKWRYQRAPPHGFDKWWAYAVKHHVQLLDEYDEIFEDIEPFWGIDPAELMRMQEELEKTQGVVTVQKTRVHSQLEVVQSTFLPNALDLQRIHDILGLVREVENDLPPLRITFSPTDNPKVFLSWQLRTMAREAAADGTTLGRADFPEVTERGWIEGCPPDSPARLHPPILPSPFVAPPFFPSMTKTFIASHRDTMNPCMNPSLLITHGQFLSHEIGPYPQQTLVPRFSLCATLLHQDIRPPVPFGWAIESGPDLYATIDEDRDHVKEEGAFEGDLPWEHKDDGRLNWRGRTTGIYVAPKSLWRHAQRGRLVTLGNTLEGNVSMLPVPKHEGQNRADTVPVGEPESMSLAEINLEWLDVAFAGKPVSCENNPSMCEVMKNVFKFKELQQMREQGRYKFILDVDGNGWSSRFKRLLTSNALVFKATIYPEWFMSRIAPWVHYVPIQVSYTDLYDTVAFFRVHDELAARIAKAGREWSRRFWRREDMTAYLYRLLLEYARVSSLDRASMDYVG